MREPVKADEEAALEERAQAAELEAGLRAQRNGSRAGEINGLDEAFLGREKKFEFAHQLAEIAVLAGRGGEEQGNARGLADAFPQPAGIIGEVDGEIAQRRRTGHGLF